MAQIAVEIYRMRQRRKPMGPFVVCAMILVCMDLIATLFIITATISDDHGANFKNGLMLILAGALACIGFFSNFQRLVCFHGKERKKHSRLTEFIQAVPSLGLLIIFLLHSKTIFEVGLLLYNAGR